jgi:hypothetical protein
MVKEKKKLFAVYIEPNVIHAIECLAKRLRIPRSAVVRNMVEAALESLGKGVAEDGRTK